MMSSVTEGKEKKGVKYDYYLKAIQEGTRKQLIYLNKIRIENQNFFKERKNIEVILNAVRKKLYEEHVSSEELEHIRDVLREVMATQKPYFNAIKSCIVKLGDTIRVLNEAFDVKH